MGKGRLEAFSDGVIAIIITIMVLEMKVPHGSDIAALAPLWPVFISYVLSFVNIGIYWNNHHHFLHAIDRVDGKVLWANLHLLFWLSLMPFATGWMGENHFAPLTVAIYAFVLLMCALAWKPFHRAVLDANPDSVLARTVGVSDRKTLLPVFLYTAAIPLAFVSVIASGVLIVAVAVMWFVPERRIEARLKERT
ncbi:MAG: TMEM175 family protein [Luteimonas sp.]